MSVLRQQNWLGQQRVDVPHVRAIESSICADFDVLAGRMISGQMPVVIQGFDTITTNAIGQPSSNLQVNVANASVMHALATESGTIFWVPSTRAVETLNASNTRLKGSFTANSKNFIGIDLVRSSDATTADIVQFLNPLSNAETPKDVPLGRTLDYVIYVSTQDFSTTPNICPIAIVTTDTSNNVSVIQDARNLLFRLGSGGSNPNVASSYSWPGGRTELGTNADFASGDKAIHSMSDWIDAVMTRLWEVGGGEYWYSPTGWQNVQLVRNGTTVFVSTGEYFEWSGTNLHWRGLRVVFSNSTGWFNDIADQLTDNAGAYGTTATNLIDGDCIYVDLDRTTNRTGGTSLTAIKGITATVGSPLIPGSRMIIAWRIGSLIFTRGNSFSVGASFVVATTSAVGTVKLQVTPGSSSAPVVFNPGVNGNLTVTASAGNTNAISAAGIGSGTGATFFSGTTGFGALAFGGYSGSSPSLVSVPATSGLVGVAVSGNAPGGYLWGIGSGSGVTGLGGTTGKGGDFTAGGNAAGITAAGAGTGAGVVGTGGATNGIGVSGQGTGAGAGVTGVGGATGIGGEFTPGGTANAVLGHGDIIATGKVQSQTGNAKFILMGPGLWGIENNFAISGGALAATAGPATARLEIPLPISVDASGTVVITLAQIWVNKSTAGTATLTLTSFARDTGVGTTLATNTLSLSGAQVFSVGSVSHTVLNSEFITLQVIMPANTDKIFGCVIGYTTNVF